jgi:hypothetical protein
VFTKTSALGSGCVRGVLINDHWMSGRVGTGAGNQCTGGNPSPSAILSTTNPTWPDLGSEQWHISATSVTNCPSWGTVKHFPVAGGWHYPICSARRVRYQSDVAKLCVQEGGTSTQGASGNCQQILGITSTCQNKENLNCDL